MKYEAGKCSLIKFEMDDCNKELNKGALENSKTVEEKIPLLTSFSDRIKITRRAFQLVGRRFQKL